MILFAVLNRESDVLLVFFSLFIFLKLPILAFTVLAFIFTLFDDETSDELEDHPEDLDTYGLPDYKEFPFTSLQEDKYIYLTCECY